MVILQNKTEIFQSLKVKAFTLVIYLVQVSVHWMQEGPRTVVI